MSLNTGNSMQHDSDISPEGTLYIIKTKSPAKTDRETDDL